jgi:hypothetical protein
MFSNHYRDVFIALSDAGPLLKLCGLKLVDVKLDNKEYITLGCLAGGQAVASGIIMPACSSKVD